jgi:biopolymer transport protein ExbB/TolQ
MNIVDSLLKVALLGSEWVMYLLIVLSVASFAAMFERWLFFRKHGEISSTLRDKVAGALQSDDIDEAQRVLAADPSVTAKVVLAALRFRSGGGEAVADAADSELARQRTELERGLNLLGTLGNNAPFIGLFGTVIGVIIAFQQLGAQGNKAAAMGNVMSGIAEALVATGVGIFVAIPAVVAYNVVQKKIGEIEADAQSLTKLVTAWVKVKQSGGTILAPSWDSIEPAPAARDVSGSNSATHDASVARQAIAEGGE